MTTEDDLKALKKVELAGSDFVLIPLNDYVELLNKQRQLAEHQADSQIILGHAGKSRLDRITRTWHSSSFRTSGTIPCRRY